MSRIFRRILAFLIFPDIRVTADYAYQLFLFLARRTRLSAKARTEMFSFSSLMLFVVSSNVPIMGSRIKLKSNGDSGSPFNSSQYVHWQDLIPAMYYDFATFVHVSLMRFGTPLIFNPLLIVL